MASQQPDALPTTLELTESETKLRDLLLAVAAYIDEGDVAEENVTGVHVPENLASEKIVLRWTGGWVRDKLLGVGSHDIDVAINKMTGEHFGLKMLDYLKIPGNAEKHGLDKKESGNIVSGLHTIKANPEASKNLETATIKIMGIDLDLVNLRKETYNEISRNPQMEFGTAEEDAMRRDATVNAMFYNLHTKQIEDFTGRGFDDMAAEIIRTPLEPFQTFKDDPLRVLRLIRFASRLHYTVDPATKAAMADGEIQQALKIKIKRERVGIELEKMLKGPDPQSALALINSCGLYRTIFTDPTRELPQGPVSEYFVPAYEFVSLLQTSTEAPLPVISQTLIRNADDKYLAWVCASLMPWADAPMVPHPKPSRPAYHAAVLVGQEGFKAPNKVCDVVAASLSHRSEIMTLVYKCHEQLRVPIGQRKPEDATARDTLGMAIRRWGSTWRTQILFSLVYDIVRKSLSRESILNAYCDFLNQLIKHDILEADTFKPLVNGKELAKAMDVKPGPWMKDALDVVMAWQLRNPENTDPAQAVEAVKQTRKSELPSRLISQFLSLTIIPFFHQSEPSKPWKRAPYLLDLLKWILSHADRSDIENNIHLLHPPIMDMLEDEDLAWRARACELITLLVKAAPADLMRRRGYVNLFSDRLWDCFIYLPSLTPEQESVTLLTQAYPTLVALYLAVGANESVLDRIMREAILAPLHHLQPASTYPSLTTLLVTHMAELLDRLKVDSIKHLQAVLPLLESILSDPFAPMHLPLLIETARALKRTIANGWPRIDPVRALEVYSCVCKAWLNCRQTSSDNLDQFRSELSEVVETVEVLMTRADDSDAALIWRREKERVYQEKSVLGDVFRNCSPLS